jgi:hypothetical protein
MVASIQVIGKEAPVMEFLCRVCGKREGEPQGWHLVIELDKPGTHIRNTIFILDRWDEKRACEPNAACFCSTGCKDQYLAARHQQLVA